MHQHRAQHLMVIRHLAVPMLLLTAVGAMDLVGREIAGAINRQQIMAIKISEPFESFAALQEREDALERNAQDFRIDGVQPLAQIRIRRGSRHAVERVQVGLNQRLIIVLVKLQQRRILETEDGQTGHQAVTQRDTTTGDLIGQFVKAASGFVKQGWCTKGLAE